MNKTILFIVSIITLLSCEPLDPNKQIDEGKVENQSYTSEEIGWTINIPENWEVISRKQNETNQEKGLELIEEVVEGDIDMSKMKNLIGFKKNIFNVFQSTSEPFELEYEGEWEENNGLIKNLIYSAFLTKGISVDSTETTITEVDGLKFQTYGFILYSPKGEVILNQIIYSKLINGYDFSVNINYNNETEKNIMLKAWYNSKFKI